MKSKVYIMTKAALIAAIMCVLGPLSLPISISPVPVSLGVLGIFLGVYAIGCVWGTVSCLIYILLGLVGLPVFAGFTGGPQKLLGPTGGYIVGYIFLTLIAGFFIDRFEKKIPFQILGMVLGTIVLYAFGTAWLAISYKMSFGAALMAGVVPYIPADAIKMVLAILVGIPLRKALKKLQ